MVWKDFLKNFNGVSVIQDIDWSSNFGLKLFTDSAGGSSTGCGAYFAGKWAALQWPEKWNNTEV